ncbi:hypothetical protein ABT324_13925 [Saccharopolyspora sp. NPDC000359]|uniref:hypothetical protein n=1 Tax=Saccharopolyspora sp. NPDC000359 TaxID=3154251 RepID=UPI003325BD7C
MGGASWTSRRPGPLGARPSLRSVVQVVGDEARRGFPGPLCLDVEVAAFLVGNHTERFRGHLRGARRAPAARCGGGALARADEALLWHVKTWNRRRPVVLPAAAERITADLERLANAVAPLS